MNNQPTSGQSMSTPCGISHTVIPIEYPKAFPVHDEHIFSSNRVYIDYDITNNKIITLNNETKNW